MLCDIPVVQQAGATVRHIVDGKCHKKWNFVCVAQCAVYDFRLNVKSVALNEQSHEKYRE